MEKINFKNLKKPYVIAEIGGNHSGKLNNSILGIKNAKKSGANCVKFQMYKADQLVLENMSLMPHVKKISNEKTQFERFKSLEITENDVLEMYKICKKIKIDFSITPFYSESVKFLSKYVSFFKIASGDINFLPLLEEISKYKKPVVLSTGMSNKKEIIEALKILKSREVILLHCISSYPTLDHQLNLRTFEMLKNFKKVIGLSDHTKGIEGAKMSLAYELWFSKNIFYRIIKLKKLEILNCL